MEMTVTALLQCLEQHKYCISVNYSTSSITTLNKGAFTINLVTTGESGSLSEFVDFE